MMSNQYTPIQKKHIQRYSLPALNYKNDQRNDCGNYTLFSLQSPFLIRLQLLDINPTEGTTYQSFWKFQILRISDAMPADKPPQQQSPLSLPQYKGYIASQSLVRKEIGVIGQGKISCLTVLKALNHGRHNRVGHRQYHHQECRKNHHISHQIFFRFLLMYQSFPELSQCSNLAG